MSKSYAAYLAEDKYHSQRMFEKYGAPLTARPKLTRGDSHAYRRRKYLVKVSGGRVATSKAFIKAL